MLVIFLSSTKGNDAIGLARILTQIPCLLLYRYLVTKLSEQPCEAKVDFPTKSSASSPHDFSERHLYIKRRINTGHCGGAFTLSMRVLPKILKGDRQYVLLDQVN